VLVEKTTIKYRRKTMLANYKNPNYVAAMQHNGDLYLRYEIAGFDLVIQNPWDAPDPVDGCPYLEHGGIFHTASLDPKCSGLIKFEEVEGGDDFDDIVEAIEKNALSRVMPDQGMW
jgi:hypothetical protein